MNRCKVHLCMFAVACFELTVNQPTEPSRTPVVAETTKLSRTWTAGQLSELRAFALKESPRLWETIQSLETEYRVRKVALKNLRDEMRNFGRDPDSDIDCIQLQKACDELLISIDSVFLRLEEAYIAYKKFEATPGEKRYSQMVRKALEDGIMEAEMAEKRYQEMSKSK